MRNKIRTCAASTISSLLLPLLCAGVAERAQGQQPDSLPRASVAASRNSTTAAADSDSVIAVASRLVAALGHNDTAHVRLLAANDSLVDLNRGLRPEARVAFGRIAHLQLLWMGEPSDVPGRLEAGFRITYHDYPGWCGDSSKPEEMQLRLLPVKHSYRVVWIWMEIC